MYCVNLRSTRIVIAAANVSHMTVWRVLGAEELQPYHAQPEHREYVLIATDHQSRVYFSRWFLQRLVVQPEFAAHMLFTDECNISRGGIFYAPNALNWTYTNSHAIRPHSYQRRFSVNVWAGVIHDHLIEP
ncbi:uncharacterized protein TNIN_336081 [Trichonephila inaurata madagascariensis]|uniref:Uncharacterized protein n=1 Tax=Trichonephila inaurata madagascariensis TaxID=2747483 RepID=A0A8X6YRE2_9ARAC|nr:uncharacterized protein TNIN_336081 [Trichonephila inaurata madagascariensis]